MTACYHSRFSGLAALCLGLSFLVGCSGQTSNGSTVTISVTYKGSPVSRAEVTVYNKASGNATPLNTREDGTCETKDLAPGEYDVTVITRPFTVGGSATPAGAAKGDPRMAQKAAPVGMSKEAKAKAAEMAKDSAYTAPTAGVTLPSKYSKKETSKLSMTIVSGKNPPVTFALDD